MWKQTNKQLLNFTVVILQFRSSRIQVFSNASEGFLSSRSETCFSAHSGGPGFGPSSCGFVYVHYLFSARAETSGGQDRDRQLAKGGWNQFVELVYLLWERQYNRVIAPSIQNKSAIIVRKRTDTHKKKHSLPNFLVQKLFLRFLMLKKFKHKVEKVVKPPHNHHPDPRILRFSTPLFHSFHFYPE